MRETSPRSAELYDAVHDARGKDYAAESARLLALIRAKAPGAATLLDVACGTGRHLQHLSEHLVCAGLDADAGMLELARRRCEDVSFVRGDMVDFDLAQRFDVVTCLFSAIGYMTTEERPRASVARMASHLLPGGLLIVEPWFRPEQWTEGAVSMNGVDEPELKAARINVSGRHGDVAILDFHWLVGTPDGVDGFVEHHELGLFSWDQYRDAFEAPGLQVELDTTGLTGRGLVLGRRG